MKCINSGKKKTGIALSWNRSSHFVGMMFINKLILGFQLNTKCLKFSMMLSIFL